MLVIPLLCSLPRQSRFDLLRNDLNVQNLFIDISHQMKSSTKRNKRSQTDHPTKHELLSDFSQTTHPVAKQRNGKMELVVDPFTTLILGKLIGIHYGLAAGKIISLGSYFKNRCCTSTTTTTTTTATPLTDLIMRRINRRRLFSSPLRKEIHTDQHRPQADEGEEGAKEPTINRQPETRKPKKRKRKPDVHEKRKNWLPSSIPTTASTNENTENDHEIPSPPFRETNEMEWMDIGSVQPSSPAYPSRPSNHPKRRRKPNP